MSKVLFKQIVLKINDNIPQLQIGQGFDHQSCTGPKILRTKCPPEFDRV